MAWGDGDLTGRHECIHCKVPSGSRATRWVLGRTLDLPDRVIRDVTGMKMDRASGRIDELFRAGCAA